MIELAFCYFNLLVFVIFYDKLKANFQTIVEDVLKILVLPIQLISWTVWKIRLLLRRR